MGSELARRYNLNPTKPVALLNSIFMTTVNTAARTLVSVASRTSTDQWRPTDHLRYMSMMMAWLAVWGLRVVVDYLPVSIGGSQPFNFLHGLSSVGLLDFPPLPSSALTPSTSLELAIFDEGDRSSPQGLGRALTHILALLNEIPAASRKYQFAVAMADKIVDENIRTGNDDLNQINREALSSAFTRTLSLLYRSLKTKQASNNNTTWTSTMLSLIPMSSYVAPYVRGIRSVYSLVSGKGEKGKEAFGENIGDVTAEKYAQELVWITNKLRVCGAVDEAIMQWSLASGVASLSLTANPRVQATIVKISSIFFMELTRGNFEVSSHAKYRLLVLWLPLFCYSDNGLAYPVLTSYEKIEVERAIDQVISTIPPSDQEVVLTNWLQDFAISASDWPNLQSSYDRWCQYIRNLANQPLLCDSYASL